MLYVTVDRPQWTRQDIVTNKRKSGNHLYNNNCATPSSSLMVVWSLIVASSSSFSPLPAWLLAYLCTCEQLYTIAICISWGHPAPRAPVTLQIRLPSFLGATHWFDKPGHLNCICTVCTCGASSTASSRSSSNCDETNEMETLHTKTFYFGKAISLVLILINIAQASRPQPY